MGYWLARHAATLKWCHTVPRPQECDPEMVMLMLRRQLYEVWGQREVTVSTCHLWLRKIRLLALKHLCDSRAAPLDAVGTRSMSACSRLSHDLHIQWKLWENMLQNAQSVLLSCRYALFNMIKRYISFLPVRYRYFIRGRHCENSLERKSIHEQNIQIKLSQNMLDNAQYLLLPCSYTIFWHDKAIYVCKTINCA